MPAASSARDGGEHDAPAMMSFGARKAGCDRHLFVGDRAAPEAGPCRDCRPGAGFSI